MTSKSLSTYMQTGGVPILGVPAGGSGASTLIGFVKGNGTSAMTATVQEEEVQVSASISSGTLTLNCSTGNVFTVPLNADITTFTPTNVPATGKAYVMRVVFTMNGTPHTVAWGANVVGANPTLTSTNGKRDSFTLTTYNATEWVLTIHAQNY